MAAAATSGAAGAAVSKPFVMLSSSQLQLLCLLAWMPLLAGLLLAELLLMLSLLLAKLLHALQLLLFCLLAMLLLLLLESQNATCLTIAG
jgi:hypothetical protein